MLKQGMIIVQSPRVFDMIKLTVYTKHLNQGLAHGKQSVSVNWYYYGNLGTQPAFTGLPDSNEPADPGVASSASVTVLQTFFSDTRQFCPPNRPKGLLL